MKLLCTTKHINQNQKGMRLLAKICIIAYIHIYMKRESSWKSNREISITNDKMRK